jgi:Ino eighty subunit 1
MSSLSHILASEPELPSASSPQTQDQSVTKSAVPTSSTMIPDRVDDDEDDDDENDNNHENANTPKPAAVQPADHTADAAATAPSTSKRTAAAPAPQLGTLYQTNKMKHLKKEDGIPLWRKDIQYDFLRHVLRDGTKCFTKYSEQTSNHTFAEVYIDAMAKSSKCSKILKDKLLMDPESAITMAMVCLLVNIGRMNTTLNCEAKNWNLQAPNVS